MAHAQGHSLDHPEREQPPQVPSPKIKICGIRSPSEAAEAAHAGVDFIGLNFVPERRRRLDLDMAQRIMSGVKKAGERRMTTVGLFADQLVEEVNRTVRECGIDLVQLCGRESMEYCELVEAPLIKVVHVAESLGPEDAPSVLAPRLAELERKGYMITLDRKVEGLQGGTGQTFDWKVAQALSQQGFSFLLAGGLTPENVSEAVCVAQPWGVDVSSGIETGDGKDNEKLRAFIAAVRGQASHPAGQ